MPYFNVAPKKEKELENKMRLFGIKQSEILERFVKSGGRGGQNVNKVATCVYLKHIPTGIEVKYGKERSQALNRFLARRILVGKIGEKIFSRISEEKHRIEKIRRQKRKRSKRAKEKMLADKKKNSQKKQLRGRVEIN